MRTTLFCFVIALTVACGDGSQQPESSSGDGVPSITSSRTCNEPENPYPEGSGHYAGFEWAERNDPSSCGGNSVSFIEGCEVFLTQSEAYNACAG